MITAEGGVAVCFELIGSRVALAGKPADFESLPVLPECFLTCEVLTTHHLLLFLLPSPLLPSPLLTLPVNP